MAYDKDTPASINERFSASQPKITANFQAIKTTFDVDHVTFDDPDQGKHNTLTLPEQSANPDKVDSDQATIFSKLSTVTGQAGLFWQKEGDGAAAGDAIEMTAMKEAASGYCILPCGLKMCWGVNSIAAGSYYKAGIIFESAFTIAPYSVQITPYDAFGAGTFGDWVLAAASVTATTFKVSRSSAHTLPVAKFYYLAIGV